jgi:hypothetical protein
MGKVLTVILLIVDIFVAIHHYNNENYLGACLFSGVVGLLLGALIATLLND